MPYDSAILKEVCPFSESDAEKAVYSTDSSRIKGEALAIAWPESAEQLQKLVRKAVLEKIPLTARGGGTSLVGGAVPNNSIVIDMSRFNRIKKLNITEKSVIVEAGVILDDLNEALEKFGLEFPIKPGSRAACSIGGIIATNAGGMLTPKFGKVEDWVDAVMVIDGTGKALEFSGAEAKKFAGTEGCCGIIVEAKLKLSELPKYYSSAFYEFENTQSMLAKVEELKKDPDAIAIEYINSIAANIAGFNAKDHLLVKYAGTKGNLDTSNADKLWKLRENIYSILVSGGYKTIEDPMIEQGMDKFLDWLNKQNIPCFGHIVYGILHPHFKSKEDIEKMNIIVKELDGKLCGEHGVGILKKVNAPFMIAQKIKDMKSKYDPHNIMNRGKVI